MSGHKRKLPVQVISAKPQPEKKPRALGQSVESTFPNMMDDRLIRKHSPFESSIYYRELLKQESVEDITSQLLQAINEGLIPPKAFAPWLGVSKSPVAIREGLKQNVSVQVRDLTIHRLSKDLSSAIWKEIWDGLGGVDGMLDIFSTLSVLEVRKACKIIGRCARGTESSEKRECITQLFQGLQPSIFPHAMHKTNDSRPLGRYYRLLLPSCSHELIESAISGELKEMLHFEYSVALLRNHSEIMRKNQLQSLHNNPSEAILNKLLQQCPPITATEPGFSESMTFSLTVLRALADSDVSGIDDEFFIKSLVQPLLARAIRKRVKSAKKKEIVDLVMQYLEVHPSAGAQITNNLGDVRHMVAECWSRKPEMFERHLRRLCSHPAFGSSEHTDIDVWGNFLEKIPKRKRYSLLRLVLQESAGLDVDLDDDLKKVNGMLAPDMLRGLSDKQAISLFTRLRMTRGDEQLVWVYRSSTDYYFALPSEYQKTDGDPDLCYIALLVQNGDSAEAEKLAASYIERRKKKCQGASQPEQRGFYARSVLWAAIASGSLSQLSSVLEWMKRFMRDPLVLRDLYKFPTRTSRLLSGIPDPLVSTSTSDLHQRVQQANSILMNMFDTVCTALQEPSFNNGDWWEAIDIVYRAVDERMNLSLQLKNDLNLSDEEIYRILWEPTIHMLISLETKANQEGHERLNVRRVRGFIAFSIYVDVALKPKTSSVIVFLDNLAKARDDLWRTLRPTVYPTAAALPAIYPRGLAVQNLVSPWFLDVQDLETFAPFLASRVKKCLFPDPVAAIQSIPESKDALMAIGPFVDSYPHALRLHIPSSCDKSEKERRIQEVWEYLTTKLSKGRMSKQEAIRFWYPLIQNYLGEWRPEGYVAPKDQKWPLIPEVDDPHEPSEWNPFSCGRPDVPARSLGEPTYIDLSVVEERHGSLSIQDTINFSNPEAPAHEVSGNTIWDQRCEGAALAAMLYLDTKFRSTKERPLDPAKMASEKKPRYPSLYLDDDFLLGDYLHPLGAVNSIRAQVATIPPILLHRLAVNLMQALDEKDPTSSQYADLQHAAYGIFIALGESDKPSLAIEIIIRVVLDKPKSSAWHRQLLKLKFLRRLSAVQARLMLQHFANEILNRLQARKNMDQKPAENLDSAQSASSAKRKQKQEDQPFVKVTTLKLLAQLLLESQIVTEDFALSILQMLYQNATHFDVRLAVVKSLLGMLAVCKADRTDAIIAALEPVVSIAGNLNERRPLTEEDWIRAEETLELPEMEAVSRYSLDSCSPLVSTLFEHYDHCPEDRGKIQAFVQRILIPVVQRLKEQTARWAALFLKKYRPSDATENEFVLPALPRHQLVFNLCFETYPERVCCWPTVVLEDYMSYVVYNISRPQVIQAFNDGLNNNARLKSRPEVQKWLDIYNKPSHANITFNLFEFFMLPSGKITPEVVRQSIFKHFSAMLLSEPLTNGHLESFMIESTKSELLQADWWQPYGKPVLESMVKAVEQIRTNTWKTDSERKPSIPS